MRELLFVWSLTINKLWSTNAPCESFDWHFMGVHCNIRSDGILILLTLQYFQLYQNLDEQNQYENTY